MSEDRLARELTPAALEATYPDAEPDQLAHTETVPAAAAETVPPGDVLPDGLADALDHDLYSHQAAALERLRDGENVTVATSTSSGKTLVYALYYALLKRRDPDARALFCYPTKALSADQERALNDLFRDLGVDASAETYDGDTKAERKPLIRANRDVVVTNFSGVNHYLSNHAKWRDVYANTDLVVIDESHTYTGVHGMHVSWVLRRLRRILDHYGSTPQFVCTSATIGNPGEHSEALVGHEFGVVERDGSPRGRRDIAFWLPRRDDDEGGKSGVGGGRGNGGGGTGVGAGDAPTDADAPTARKRAGAEAASVAGHLGLSGVQTLAFLRSRQGTEIAAKRAREAARDHPLDARLDAKPYHAGLSKQKRRAVENTLKSGRADAVFTTSALELGIDVGGVDATVLAGYPGTRQSFWQQIGRAGRGTSDALSVFVPRRDAIDRYILDDPDYLLGDEIEDAVVDVSNNHVYARHVRCAAEELPLTAADATWFGPRERLERAVSVWRDAGEFVGDLERGAQYDGRPRPQASISLYATTDVEYEVRRVDGDIDMEPIGRERAYRDYHPGALVLYDGEQYEVVDLVEDRHRPYVELERVRTNEYTTTAHEKRIHDVEATRSRDLGGGYSLHAGTGTVEIDYTQYRRHDIGDGTVEGPYPIDLPPIELRTHLTWVELPADMERRVIDALGPDALLDADGAPATDAGWTFAGGLHGAEHGMIKLAPLELRLDNSDMGGLSTPMHAETGAPTWFIHDAVEGGVGFAHSIYDHFEGVAAKTRERVARCDCADPTGCPSCLMSAQCGNDNEPLHRGATTAVLDAVLSRLDAAGDGSESEGSHARDA
ncbi:DEAD/DEAH box helicase domain-containing protein [Halarchaeum rubridurum]|uniref:Helicase n=1 Tax=Halarchaeum rubridurum TaxID=489911 RepID=A0A830FQA3_9EURY|nr:DEAD/DEAH box helicase [Halarchaeum rubridurum]MBP1954867.1 DEAD/DEAH box helicase domain-containing protein [Halarchaeum rubridurum]GGM60373.1 helicase [Halarchaeum rubridurum]